MKRIPRDPLRIDVFGLFAAHAQEPKVAIHTREAAEGFLQRIRNSVEALLNNAAFVYGQRTQALFEALVVDLGEIRFLKQEDAGEVYSTDDLKIPDFRLILADGTRLLVEVKNHSQANPADALVVAAEYLDRLRRYAALMGCPLKVAVFWHRWNMWTLVPPEVFTLSGAGAKCALAFGDAMKRNEMALLGDKAIGTTFPLRMRFIANPATDRTVQPDGSVQFTLSDIKLYCRNAEITDPAEKNIAWYLMMYGKWESEPSEAIIVADQLEAIEERFMPPEDHGQGFEIIGWLSGMYSSCYRQATVTDGRVGQLLFEPVPGQLGRLIPTGYEGKALPLWVFILSPAK